MTLKLVIAQPYVPAYRVEFFSRLVKELAKEDIDCRIVASRPEGPQSNRGDESAGHPWARDAKSSDVSILGRSVRFLGASRNWAESDALILGLLGTSPDLYWELLKTPISKRKIGVWGHIKPFVNPGNRLDLSLETMQMHRSDHVFGYTSAGRDYAVRRGITPSKITTVLNSLDTEPMRLAYERLDIDSVQSFVDQFDLHLGKVFCYIGGIDSAKRIDILADALDRVWDLDKEVKVLVAGRGDQEHLLNSHVARGQVIRLGYAGAADKAMAAHVSEAIVNPGRVGLLAVEALALGLPILTTSWPFHAPEYDYLVPSESVFISGCNGDGFAELMMRSISDKGELRVSEKRPSWEFPTVDNMVANYKQGVMAMVY